jgi:hypothetical protein
MVKPGYVLYVPPYWFYSIEFQDKANEVCMVKYTTGANLLANAKHIGMYYMQQQNIQEKWWKQLATDDSVETKSEETITGTSEYVDLSRNMFMPPPIVSATTVAEKLVDELTAK